jgi:hypothetical protein
VDLLPLAVPAAAAVSLRHEARNEAQRRAVVAGAAGSLVLLLSLLKRGSYLNVLVAAEPPLLVLAVCGWTWLLTRGPAGRRWLLALCVAVAALGMVEVVSLLASPTKAALFGRPFAASAPAWVLTDGQVNAQVAQISRCRPRVAYSGQPYLAFATRRRMPGNQPDQFIIGHAAVDARFLDAATRDQPRCP